MIVAQSCPTLQPHGLPPARLLCPWNSLGKNTGEGCHSLLQGIFPTLGLNPGLPHHRQILYCLRYQGSPSISHNKWYFKAGNKINVIIKKKNITDLPGLQDLYFWDVRALNRHEKFWTGLRFWNTGTDSHKAKHTLNNRFSCIQISFVGHLEDR